MLVEPKDLTGWQLDFMVGVAMGRTDITVEDFDELGLGCVQSQPDPFMNNSRCWAPSRYWQQGGTIIERENIVLDGYVKLGVWTCVKYLHEGDPVEVEGPTPLIAAMRCYVASKLGPFIKLPEELLQCRNSHTS